MALVGHADWTGMPAFAFGRLASLRAGELVYTGNHRSTQSAAIPTPTDGHGDP